ALDSRRAARVAMSDDADKTIQSEFTAFAPDRGREAALELGEAIRGALKANPIDCGGGIVRPTLSIGVAAFPPDGASPEKLTRCADEALYRAKAAGRDRVSA